MMTVPELIDPEIEAFQLKCKRRLAWWQIANSLNDRSNYHPCASKVLFSVNLTGGGWDTSQPFSEMSRSIQQCVRNAKIFAFRHCVENGCPLQSPSTMQCRMWAVARTF